MTEHTPGPWEAAALGTIIRTKTGVNDRGGMTGGVLVAQFFGADRPSEADVNLIVAAPDLLEAAKKLRAAQRAYMTDRGNEDLGKAVGAAAAELDAAISKAEGR